MSQNGIRSRTPLVTFLIVLGIVIAVIVKMIAPYLLALFLGGIVALLSLPFFDSLRARRVGPKLSAAIVTLSIFLLGLVPLSAFAVAAVRQGVALGDKIAETGFSFQRLSRQVAAMEPVKSAMKNTPGIKGQINSGIQAVAKAVAGYVIKIVKNIPTMLLQLLLAALTCFFFLVDGKRFFGWMLNKLPLETDIQDKLVDSFISTTVSSVWGGFAAAGVQTIVLFAAYLALSIPGAFLAGGVTFILSWTPMVGSAPISLAAIGYLFFQGENVKMVIMIVIGVLTGVLDNVVRAWVLKGREEMHPFVGLIAIIAGIDMFGIFGVFIGPVLVAILISLLDVWPKIGHRFNLTSGTETKLT